MKMNLNVKIVFMNTLKDRINFALKRANATQGQLAKACNISRPTVTAWCVGKSHTMSAKTAILAAKYLNIDVNWLLTGQGTFINTIDNVSINDLTPLVAHVLIPPPLNLEGEKMIYFLTDNTQVIKTGLFLSKKMLSTLGVNDKNALWFVADEHISSHIVPQDSFVLAKTDDTSIKDDSIYLLYFKKSSRFTVARCFNRVDGSLFLTYDKSEKLDLFLSVDDARDVDIIGRIVFVAFQPK